MRRLSTPTSEIARVNVTPIIDVALVLVIILLITAPILTVTDREIELPSARSKEPDAKTHIHVTLGAAGDLGIEDQVVSREQFVSSLQSRLQELDAKQTLVVVRADRSASHGEVKRVLEEVRAAGAERLAFAIRPRGRT